MSASRSPSRFMPETTPQAMSEARPRSTPSAARVLIVIPALNEAAHIAGVLDFAAGFAERVDGLVVVADEVAVGGDDRIHTDPGQLGGLFIGERRAEWGNADVAISPDEGHGESETDPGHGTTSEKHNRGAEAPR